MVLSTVTQEIAILRCRSVRVTEVSGNTVTYSSTFGRIEPSDLRVTRYEGMKSDTALGGERSAELQKAHSPTHPTSRPPPGHLGHPDYKL